MSTRPPATGAPTSVSLADEDAVRRILTDTLFGIGTVLESMMIWQLLQVRHLHDTPLIFAGPMWKGLVDWTAAQMLRPVSSSPTPRT